MTLRAALGNRRAELGTADADRNAVFNIPVSLAPASPAARPCTASSTGPDSAGLQQATETPANAEASAVRTPRKPAMSPRYLPAVVAAGMNIIADSKDIIAPPPTRDRKKRQLRPQDHIGALLTDASNTLSELEEEQAEDFEQYGEAPDSPISKFVRSSSTRQAQSWKLPVVQLDTQLSSLRVRSRHGSKETIQSSPRGEIEELQAANASAAPDYSKAAEEALNPPQDFAQSLSLPSSSQRVLTPVEMTERQRRTLDWFRQTDRVNSQTRNTDGFSERLSALRRRRRGGQEEAATGGAEESQAAVQDSAEAETGAVERCRSIDPSAPDNPPTDAPSGGSPRSHRVIKRLSSRGLFSNRTME